MSYLELARQALQNAPEALQSCAPDADPECEKSERSEKSPLAAQEDEDQVTCRIIERDLGMTPGSLTLWKPIHLIDP